MAGSSQIPPSSTSSGTTPLVETPSSTTTANIAITAGQSTTTIETGSIQPSPTQAGVTGPVVSAIQQPIVPTAPIASPIASLSAAETQTTTATTTTPSVLPPPTTSPAPMFPYPESYQSLPTSLPPSLSVSMMTPSGVVQTGPQIRHPFAPEAPASAAPQEETLAASKPSIIPKPPEQTPEQVLAAYTGAWRPGHPLQDSSPADRIIYQAQLTAEMSALSTTSTPLRLQLAELMGQVRAMESSQSSAEQAPEDQPQASSSSLPELRARLTALQTQVLERQGREFMLRCTLNELGNLD